MHQCQNETYAIRFNVLKHSPCHFTPYRHKALAVTLQGRSCQRRLKKMTGALARVKIEDSQPHSREPTDVGVYAWQET